jgi:hypothetical protein
MFSIVGSNAEHGSAAWQAKAPRREVQRTGGQRFYRQCTGTEVEVKFIGKHSKYIQTQLVSSAIIVKWFFSTILKVCSVGSAE